MIANTEKIEARNQRKLLRVARANIVMGLRGHHIYKIIEQLKALEVKGVRGLAQRLAKGKTLTPTMWYNLTTQ
jgi:hypothetical protein